MKTINTLALFRFWVSRIPLVLPLLLVWQGVVNAENRIINYDLNLGILFHDEPTFVHPTDPPTHPNGEIEDNYFSDTMRFAPITLSNTPGTDSARIVVNFVNSVTGVTQRLRLDAEETGSPFPETFALRFPGEPSHATIGPGMFLTSSQGTIEGVGDGTLAVTLTGIARSTSDTSPPTNPYSVSFRCLIDNCTTDAHFPDSRDLTDAHVTFTGLVLDVTLDNFERCSASRPDCDGITFDGFGFSMLAGDIAIQEPDRVVALTFDLNDGTFNQRAGTAEDSYLSGPISFSPVTLEPDANTLELQIRFRDSARDTLQRLEIAALGTGAPNPETFASRLPGDPCFDDGLPSPGMPCEHSFGPGMVISNSSGSLGDAFTTMQTTVSLRGVGGTFANDFINPYVAKSNPSLVNPVSICGHSDADECTSGPHFPDLVDGNDVASFHQLVVDLDFGSTVGSTVPITVDTFEFNMLAGSLESKFTFLPSPSVGGSAKGMTLRSIGCKNRTTGQRVGVPIPDNGEWNCEAADLNVDPGDRVRQRLIGRADGTASVGGAVTGVDANKVRCENRDTGQQVSIRLTRGDTTWDCEAAGLRVRTGDKIRQAVQGKAE